MKDMTWYVTEVSFRESNPIHRALCFHRSNGFVELYGSYEGVERHNIKDLAFFRMVEPITAMNARYPNQYLHPSEVEEGVVK